MGKRSEKKFTLAGIQRTGWALMGGLKKGGEWDNAFPLVLGNNEVETPFIQAM